MCLSLNVMCSGFYRMVLYECERIYTHLGSFRILNTCNEILFGIGHF